MKMQVPFPRLVYGSRDLFYSIGKGMRRHPIGGTLSILGLIILLGLSYVSGLRNGYTYGYFLSVQQQALFGATTTMNEIQHLVNQDSTSLHFALDVELDGQIQSLLYSSDDSMSPPWYMGGESKTKAERTRSVYTSVLSELASYRVNQPTKVVSEGSHTYNRLLDYVPEGAMSNNSDLKHEN